MDKHSIYGLEEAFAQNSREAWVDAALSVQKIAEVSEESAEFPIRETNVVKLIIQHIANDSPGPSRHLPSCTGALTSISVHGDAFKSCTHENGGSPAVAAILRQNQPARVRSQALRFISEFSDHLKWIPDLISADVIVPILTMIGAEQSTEITSKAANFIGNMASEEAVRDAIIKEQGVKIISNRLQKWGHIYPGTSVLDFKYEPKDQDLPGNLLLL